MISNIMSFVKPTMKTLCSGVVLGLLVWKPRPYAASKRPRGPGDARKN